ncbi:MAG: hypothetical protein R3C05_29175 [Pirellulaceae bacterium]
MQSTTICPPAPPESSTFVDRRGKQDPAAALSDRRQFASSHDGLSPDAKELAMAIDSYKLQYRRRYITFDEMLSVVKSLGYSR